MTASCSPILNIAETIVSFQPRKSVFTTIFNFSHLINAVLCSMIKMNLKKKKRKKVYFSLDLVCDLVKIDSNRNFHILLTFIVLDE